MSLRSEIIKVINEIFSGSRKISDLDAAGTLNDADLLEVVQGGVNKKATVSQISTGSFSALDDWNFATSGPSPGDFPTDQTKIYIVTDDSVYPSGTWIGYTSSTGWTAK